MTKLGCFWPLEECRFEGQRGQYADAGEGDGMKPVSPLPWREQKGYIMSDAGKIIVDAGGGDADDFPYIVHAANLYPRLVVLLRAAIQALDAVEKAMPCDCDKDENSYPCLGGRCSALAALLAAELAATP
jgi:hypothetical protein